MGLVNPVVPNGAVFTHLHPRLCCEGTACPLGARHALKAQDADQQTDTPQRRPRTKIGHALLFHHAYQAFGSRSRVIRTREDKYFGAFLP